MHKVAVKRQICSLLPLWCKNNFISESIAHTLQSMWQSTSIVISCRVWALGEGLQWEQMVTWSVFFWYFVLLGCNGLGQSERKGCVSLLRDRKSSPPRSQSSGLLSETVAGGIASGVRSEPAAVHWPGTPGKERWEGGQKRDQTDQCGTSSARGALEKKKEQPPLMDCINAFAILKTNSSLLCQNKKRISPQ